MKNYITYSFLIIVFFAIIEKQVINGFILLLIALLPPLLVFLIESKENKFIKNKFIKDLNYILNISINLSAIVFLILIISTGIGLLYEDLGEVRADYIMFNSLYYFILIFWFLLTNYFATSSSELRKSVKAFIMSIENFFNKNFLISILAIIFVIMLTPISKEMLIAIVSSYLFFFLTEINKFYKDNKVNEKSYKRYNLFLQVITNLSLIIVFADFEKLFKHIIYDYSLGYSYWLNIPLHMVLFSLIITISHCAPIVINWFRAILKNRKR